MSYRMKCVFLCGEGPPHNNISAIQDPAHFRSSWLPLTSCYRWRSARRSAALARLRAACQLGHPGGAEAVGCCRFQHRAHPSPRPGRSGSHLLPGDSRLTAQSYITGPVIYQAGSAAAQNSVTRLSCDSELSHPTQLQLRTQSPESAAAQNSVTRLSCGSELSAETA